MFFYINYYCLEEVGVYAITTSYVVLSESSNQKDSSVLLKRFYLFLRLPLKPPTKVLMHSQEYQASKNQFRGLFKASYSQINEIRKSR